MRSPGAAGTPPPESRVDPVPARIKFDGADQGAPIGTGVTAANDLSRAAVFDQRENREW
jgi:hypothetical protein